MSAVPDPVTGLLPGWEIRFSRSRSLPYFYNPESGESVWEPPYGCDENKLREYIQNNPNMLQAKADNSNEEHKGEIRASHLLIKHRDSRRPSSWKEANITRTKEEALSIILGHEARIRSGAVSLAELAKTESDCSSARKGGDLGWFGRNVMQKEFEDAAFSLKVGEVSRVVETGSGLHLIERTA